MTQQFHAGDDVEILQMRADRHLTISERGLHWRKAQIVRAWLDNDETDTRGVPNRYAVQFPDGQRAVFDAEHIRLSKEQVEQDLIENGERFLDAMGDEVKP